MFSMIECDECYWLTLLTFRRFYAQGYADGHAHGQLHGLFEGRELGREKGFELWEEVGYYEGTALFWMENIAGQSESRGKNAR